MNKQQKIFNILAKEQKPMKVEFIASINDLKAGFDKGLQYSAKGLDFVLNAEREFKKALDASKSNLNQLEKSFTAAKELGVQEAIKQIQDLIDSEKENISYCESSINKLKSI